jgi:hypothetical protein
VSGPASRIAQLKVTLGALLTVRSWFSRERHLAAAKWHVEAERRYAGEGKERSKLLSEGLITAGMLGI